MSELPDGELERVSVERHLSEKEGDRWLDEAGKMGVGFEGLGPVGNGRLRAYRFTADPSRLFDFAQVVAVKPKKAKVAPPSERGLKFADWFRSTLATETRLATGWRENWARVFDEMVALDERTPEEIAKVCRWARAHEFWRAQFLSPAKLRERKGGVQYFDRFAEAMRAGGGGGGAAARKAAVAAGQYAIDDGHGPQAVSAADVLRKDEA